jgi:hypothetical protein
MAAGLTDHVWSLEGVGGIIEAEICGGGSLEMLGPIFGALDAFLVFAVIALVFAVASGILFIVKRHKAARVLAILTSPFLGLTVFIYWSIWGFSWFA